MDHKKESLFTKYEVFVIAILSILQFTVILDFMVLSPLGAILMKDLGIKTSQFGLVVSAYAFSAGASGLLAAGFADRFDRKKLLLFFYAGFIIGTLLCAISTTHYFLLIARIVTGIFGGVMSSIGFAIITDLFKMEVRGRVMGFTQMSFAASQILGIPIGLLMANKWGWQSPFWLIAAFSIAVAILVAIYMRPVVAHLKVKNDKNAFQHLVKTISNSRYITGFSATVLLAIGGFMLMPFGSAFSIYNLGLTMEDLPLIYGVAGLFSMGTGPLIGYLSDRIGKYYVFCIGSVISLTTIFIYTNFGITPLWLVILVNTILFIGITTRIISSSALTSAIPQLQDRGAYMSINSSIQQISGGVGAAVAGLIVFQVDGQPLQNYDILGYVSMGAIAITVGLMYFVHTMVPEK